VVLTGEKTRSWYFCKDRSSMRRELSRALEMGSGVHFISRHMTRPLNHFQLWRREIDFIRPLEGGFEHFLVAKSCYDKDHEILVSAALFPISGVMTGRLTPVLGLRSLIWPEMVCSKSAFAHWLYGRSAIDPFSPKVKHKCYCSSWVYQKSPQAVFIWVCYL
jgi:hypothetical protein